VVTRISEITGVDWSPKLGAIGEVVENLDDINQCLRIILETPKGSRPHEPLFGSDLFRYVDHPVNTGMPRMIAAAIDAVTLWEPRVRLISISPVYDEAGSGKITLWLEWTLKHYTSETRTLEVTP